MFDWVAVFLAWYAAAAEHDELDSEWHRYGDELTRILASPLMRNLKDPAVAEAVRAMARARELRTTRPPRPRVGDDTPRGYIDAVEDYRRAMRVAVRRARINGIRHRVLSRVDQAVRRGQGRRRSAR